MLKKWRDDIAEKTYGMARKEKCAYIRMYYWYHILITAAILFLILLFAGHFLFGNRPPRFYCVMVNQPVSSDTLAKMTEAFAGKAGLEESRTVIDSNYIFSYGDVAVTGANESTYEKFFLQWRNEEIDAVILPESFYLFCREMGGGFRSLDPDRLEEFKGYMDDHTCKAVVLGKDALTGEDLLLAFPDNGRHREAAEEFLDYMIAVKKGKIGGVAYEEIINR